MLNRILTLDVFPPRASLGLLILRIGVGGSLFLRHGLEKVQNFSLMAAHFPNPIHIGSHASLVIALISDAICSILIALGLFTRLAALYIFINIFVVWSLVQGFAFFGKGGGEGELCVLYCAASLTLFFTGGGRFSIDHALGSRPSGS